MNKMEQRVNERLGKFGLSMERGTGSSPSAIVARCATCKTTKLIRGVNGAHLPPDIAVKKLTLSGWAEQRGLWHCPACTSPLTKEPDMATAPSPDLKTLRTIMHAIEEHFDVERGCYRGGVTDEALAKRLGYSPAIVAKVREEAFGPLRPQVPAEVVQLQKDIADLRQMLADMEDRVAKVVQGYHSRAAA